MTTGSGVILRDSTTQAVITGTATGGSTTTIEDAGKNFVTLGVAVGDRVVVWDGAGLNQRGNVVAPITATVLTVGALPVAWASGSRYMVIRNSFIILRGTLKIRHEHRLPSQGIPGRAGDVQQPLARKSRVARMERGLIYRGDLASASRDAQHVTEAQQLRTWSDAGTSLRLDSLTEDNLTVRISLLDVEEEAGAKGFPVSLQVVEVV